jgi:hypothetical protein
MKHEGYRMKQGSHRRKRPLRASVFFFVIASSLYHRRKTSARAIVLNLEFKIKTKTRRRSRWSLKCIQLLLTIYHEWCLWNQFSKSCSQWKRSAENEPSCGGKPSFLISWTTQDLSVFVKIHVQSWTASSWPHSEHGLFIIRLKELSQTLTTDICSNIITA